MQQFSSGAGLCPLRAWPKTRRLGPYSPLRGFALPPRRPIPAAELRHKAPKPRPPKGYPRGGARQYADAARGAATAHPHRTCFRTVTLPLAAPGLLASAIFVFLESLDEFTGTYFVGVPDVTTLPLLMFNATMGGNYQISSITALLLQPSLGFMLVVERFLKADVLALVGR